VETSGRDGEKEVRKVQKREKASSRRVWLFDRPPSGGGQHEEG